MIFMVPFLIFMVPSTLFCLTVHKLQPSCNNFFSPPLYSREKLQGHPIPCHQTIAFSIFAFLASAVYGLFTLTMFQNFNSYQDTFTLKFYLCRMKLIFPTTIYTLNVFSSNFIDVDMNVDFKFEVELFQAVDSSSHIQTRMCKKGYTLRHQSTQYIQGRGINFFVVCTFKKTNKNFEIWVDVQKWGGGKGLEYIDK